MFTLVIHTSGAAFDDAAPEVERILNRLASKVRNGDVTPGGQMNVLDANGNTCGEVIWEPGD